MIVPSAARLASNADPESVLRAAVRSPGPDTRRDDVWSWEWVLRYAKAADAARRAELVHAAGRLLRKGTSEEAEAGITMLRQWKRHPEQPAALEPALRDDSHLRAVGGAPLLGRAWQAAAAALEFDPPGLRERLRTHAFDPATGTWVWAALGRDDTEWFEQNAPALVDAQPEALGLLLYTLSRRRDDLTGVVEQLDRPDRRGDLRLAIRQEIKDEQQRLALLALLK